MLLRLVTRAATAAALLAAAGAAAPALAQDCRLSVSPVDPVLMPGESTPVYVWAHFPPTAYAFASSEFVVRATIPAWTFASAGAIAGADVLGITADQAHSPPMGVLADPANPRRIWNGGFTPDSYNPALVEVRATPSAFEFYPSDLTSSSVPCDARPGRAWIMVNPIAAGRTRVAPGEGTGIEVVGDDLIISSGEEAIRIGLLLPAIQKVREAAATPPDSMTIETVLEPTAAGSDHPTESHTLNFTRIETTYNAQIEWPLSHRGGVNVLLGDGSVRFIQCDVGGGVPFPLAQLPDTHRCWVEVDEANGRTTVIRELGFDREIQIEVPGAPALTTRTIELRLERDEALPLGIGPQIWFATGTPSLSLTIGSGCAADVNDDSAVNSNDISAFLALWLASVQNGTPDADFDANGAVNSSDISAFLAAWLDAVHHGC